MYWLELFCFDNIVSFLFIADLFTLATKIMCLFLCVCEFHGPSLEGKDKHCQDSSIDKFPYADKVL